MTRILFERSGGFMGRTVSLNIDMDDLPEDEAGALRELLDEADFFDLPDDLRRVPAPDEFTYSITVVVEERQHSVRVSDTSMPDDLRPLLNELTKLLRRKR
ncbi:MAG: protealysin inhibitor emfourin [Chloroflexota bacterium]